MAGIVGIHGIAQQFRGGYQLGSAWYDAIRDGLAVAGYRTSADALAPADVRVAFFADLFRPAGSMAVHDPPFSAADVQPGAERELLTALYQAAVDQDPSLDVPEGAMSARVAVDAEVDGYPTGFPYTSTIDTDTSVISIDGAAPTPGNVRDGSYPFVAVEHLYVPPHPTALAQSFLAYLPRYLASYQSPDYTTCSNAPRNLAGECVAPR
jgi:hypothetical protein